MESRIRSLLKAGTWRVSTTAITFLIAYVVTGSFTVSALIAGIEGTAKIAIYYGHERLWARSRWGLVVPTLSKPTPKSWQDMGRSLRVEGQTEV